MRLILALALLVGVAYAATPIHYVTPTYDNSQPAAGAVIADCGCNACPCASAPLGTNVVIDDEPTRYPSYNSKSKAVLMKTFGCQKPKNQNKPKCNKKKTAKAAKTVAKVANDIAKLKNKVAQNSGNPAEIKKALATVQKDKAKVASGKAQVNSKATQGPQSTAVKKELKKEQKQLKKIEKKLTKQLAKTGASPAPAAAGAKNEFRAQLTAKAIKVAKLVRAIEEGLLKNAKMVDEKKSGVTDRVEKNKAAMKEARAQLAEFRKMITEYQSSGKITAEQAKDENKAADMIQKKLDVAIPKAIAIVKEDNLKKKAEKAAAGPKLW